MSGQKLIEIIYSLSDKISAHRKKHLKDLELSKAEFKGLVCMDKDQQITCKDFSERMKLSLSRGSRIIDKLYQKNYILRTDYPSDRRCKMIQLTEKGKKARSRINNIIKKCEKTLTSGVSEDKLSRLKKDLLNLIQKL
jgi:DNA-binding MarR family transcriptional regulator